MIPDNFADHPKSITEIRSDKSRRASDWTPRDVLVSLLRDIDSGERKVTSVVVAIMNEEEGAVSCSYLCSTRTHTETLGIMTHALFAINRDTERDAK
jgi:hypothetical protein